jgi:hypothetical protein
VAGEGLNDARARAPAVVTADEGGHSRGPPLIAAVARKGERPALAAASRERRRHSGTKGTAGFSATWRGSLGWWRISAGGFCMVGSSSFAAGPAFARIWDRRWLVQAGEFAA